MVDSRSAVIFSATLVLLFSIPAASQQVEIQETVESGFDAVVDTNFTTNFKLNISSGSEEMKLIDSESRYSIDTRPSTQIKKFTTPKGKLKIVKSPNRSITTVETPYGTLKTGFRDGENVSSFSGEESMRPEVEKIREELLTNMSVREREASAKKAVVMDRILPDVKIRSGYTESSEYVEVTNTGSEVVPVEGWTFENSDPDAYTLDTVLAANETIRYYAGEPETVENNSVLNTGVDIDENEDSLRLENRFGRVIDREQW